MDRKEGLPVEIRRRAYQLALDIYESFEALPERGVLAHDIESTANRLIKLIAAFSISDNKTKLLSDIFVELKGLRALLGIVRDTSVLERQPASKLMDEVSELYELFHKESEGFNIASPLSSHKAGGEDSADIKSMEVSRLTEKIEPAPKGSFLVRSEEMKIHKPEPVLQKSEPVVEAERAVRSSHSARQEAIIEVLKRRTKISVGELDTLFSQRVSKKTLQRDLQGLIDRNIIERHGDKRWATYSLRDGSENTDVAADS